MQSSSGHQQSIYCVNSGCSQPQNPMGGQVCSACNTPLVYRYLWAVGPQAVDILPDTWVAERYSVVAPQVWLDTQPAHPPYFPEELPNGVNPYLFLYPYRLHIPEIYGFAPLGETPDSGEILLLENAPIDPVGNLYPSLAEVWPAAQPVRQIYWLWQIFQLWKPLSEQGVAGSLLLSENLRCEGWRVCLLELYPDAVTCQEKLKPEATLSDLAHCWMNWISSASASVAQPLKEICQQMRAKDAKLEEIGDKLNRLLLELSAQLPLRLRVAGATDVGKLRSHNEDTCFPLETDLKQRSQPEIQQLIPYFAVVCDGVGGHEGGEVASQSAVQTLKPLIQGLLTEIAQSSEPTAPHLVTEQIAESLRVINNTIAAQNNHQNRSLRQRMGTTLVMALQLPQRVKSVEGVEYANANELYLAHVGDSRAYWLTGESCQRLTVDDDVASREVSLGRCAYREALDRFDAGALTQALGTRDGEFLKPNVQRFILEEDGLLLLCSDGLSDNDLVELFWPNYAPAVLKGELPLESAVQALIDLANERNGHDNTSVVILQCRLSPEPITLFTPASTLNTTEKPLESEFSEASRALLDAEASAFEPQSTTPNSTTTDKKSTALELPKILAAFLMASLLGLFTWSQLNPAGFNAVRERIFSPSNQ